MRLFLYLCSVNKKQKNKKHMKTKVYYDIIRENNQTDYCVSFEEFKKELKRWKDYNIITRFRKTRKGCFVTKTLKGIDLNN